MTPILTFLQVHRMTDHELKIRRKELYTERDELMHQLRYATGIDRIDFKERMADVHKELEMVASEYKRRNPETVPVNNPITEETTWPPK